MFDRHASLAGNQIINYRVSPDNAWFVLVGISTNPAAGQPGQNAFKIKGSMQLYSVERGVSQPIEGHAAVFASVKLDGASTPSKLFAFANRTATGAKVSSTRVEELTCSFTSLRSVINLQILPLPRKQSMSSSLPKPPMISQSLCKCHKSTVSSTLSRNSVSSTYTKLKRDNVSI